jgi:FkbM family methyltransferase
MLIIVVLASALGCDQRSLSQSGEENTLIDNVFPAKQGGVYVEIGALDGITKSNTLKLKSCHQWNGLLVEGNPTNYAALKTNRPNPDVVVHSAVCAPPQTHVTFVESGGAISGDINEMSKKFKARWKTQQHGTVMVPCLPMSHILQKAGITHVDFFSLDVEGAELTVLETIDFKMVSISVFVIELDDTDLRKNWKIRRLLHNLDYFECTFPKASDRNGWFVHKHVGIRCGQ